MAERTTAGELVLEALCSAAQGKEAEAPLVPSKKHILPWSRLDEQRDRG